MKFEDFIASQGAKVIVDEVGLCIAREKLVDGTIYARALEVSESMPKASRADWERTLSRLDREFCSLLAYHGIIELPDEFR